MPSFSDLDQTKHKLLSVSNPIPKQALSFRLNFGQF